MPDKLAAAELRCAREYLGLSTLWLADYLAVKEREIFRWERGDSPIPAGAATEILDLIDDAQILVDRLVKRYTAELAKGEGATIFTYRNDTDYRIHQESAGLPTTYPARWHRAVCQRVVHQLPDLTVVYASVSRGPGERDRRTASSERSASTESRDSSTAPSGGRGSSNMAA